MTYACSLGIRPSGTQTRMAAREVLTEIIELEELQRNTHVTNNVLSTAHRLIGLQTEEEIAHLSSLVTGLRSSYSKMLERVERFELLSSKIDKLLVLFHEFTTHEGNKICRECDTVLGLKAHDVFWQLFMEKEFMLKIVKELQMTSSLSDADTSPRQLTVVEENAVRYTAGFVIRKLLKKYCKKKTQKEVECSRFLNEMASKAVHTGESTSSRDQHQSKTWISLADRGGLYHVSDAVFDFFVVIEMKTNNELSSIFQQKGRGIEKVQKEQISWLCDDEEVQFVWSSISPLTIEEERVRQELLHEICFLWVTTRGHSKAQQLKDELKKSKAQSTKGRRSLRKEMMLQPREQHNE